MVEKYIVVGLIFISDCIFAQNTNALKPLDPKARNYFCEKTFDGKLTKEGFKLNDSVYGEMRLYEQGKLLCVLNFINEEQNGSFLSYYFESGQVHEDGQYKNGKKEGIWKEYNVDGKLISTKKYKNDEQIE